MLSAELAPPTSLWLVEAPPVEANRCGLALPIAGRATLLPLTDELPPLPRTEEEVYAPRRDIARSTAFE